MSAEMILLAAAGVGTGLQAYGQYKQGKAQEEAYKQNAAISAQESEIAEKEAEREREVYGEEAREHRKEAKRLKARQIALYAKSGVKAGTGTPLIVSKATQEQMERQARIIQEHGQYAYEQGMSESALLTSESGLYKSMAKSAGERGLWTAGSTLATGLGSMGWEYYKYKKKK